MDSATHTPQILAHCRELLLAVFGWWGVWQEIPKKNRKGRFEQASGLQNEADVGERSLRLLSPLWPPPKVLQEHVGNWIF